MEREAILYLRSSTKTQNPKLQEKKCIEFANERNLKIIKIFSEKKSAYKEEVEREEWENCVKLAKDNRYDIVLFRYDRSFRRRKEFVEFMKEMHQLYKVKVYSVSENWLNSMWDGLDKIPNLPEPFNKIISMFMDLIWNILIELIGEQAEEESRKKGLSVKNAIRHRQGKTISYKGNKWGRKALSKQTRDKVIQLREEGKTIREISQLVKTTDKNKNMVPISKSVVHKILMENSIENGSKITNT